MDLIENLIDSVYVCLLNEEDIHTKDLAVSAALVFSSAPETAKTAVKEYFGCC